ncbi:MAG: winged helix-turn-helix transcriptional regulator [Rhodospirillales bacterium]
MNNDSRITLGLLNAVDEGESLTQRGVAKDLGIALGLANAYLKRCVKKGYVKVRQIPKGRYAYYLTPQGFTEKSRLTAEYLGQSFSLYRQAREQYAALLAECEQRGWSRAALWGAGDLAEIAALLANGGVSIIGVIDPAVPAGRMDDVPVVDGPEFCSDADAVIITSLADPQGAYDAACAAFGAERVLAPVLLHVSQKTPVKPLRARMSAGAAR